VSAELTRHCEYPTISIGRNKMTGSTGGGYDIHLNSIKADLKKTSSHNNMVRYAKHAVKKQGVDMVVFEFGNK